MKNYLSIVLLTLFLLSSCKEKPTVHIRGFIPVKKNGVVIIRTPTGKEVVNIINYKFDVEVKNALAGFYDVEVSLPPRLGDTQTVVYGNGEIAKLKKLRSNFKTIYIDPTEDQNYYIKINKSSQGDLDSLSQLEVHYLRSILTSKSYNSQVYEKVNLIHRSYELEKNEKEAQLSVKKDFYLEKGDMPNYTKFTDSLRELWKVVFIPKLNADYITLMKANLQSEITPFMIITESDINNNYNDFAFILKNLKGKAANSKYAKLAKLKLASIKGTEIGQKVSEIIGKINQDESFVNKFSESKYTLIEFWASWCGPCRQKNPAFIKIYDRYHKNGFDIISVSLDDKKENWLAAILVGCN